MSIKIIRRFPNVNQPGFEFSKWNTQFHTHNVILNGLYSNYYYPIHWTPLSMKCAFGGNEYYIKNNIKYSVNDSCFLIFNDGTLYDSSINSESKVESFTINFNKKFSDDALSSLSKTHEQLLDMPEPQGGVSYGFFEKLYPHDITSRKILSNIRRLINLSFTDKEAINEQLYSLIEYMYRIQKSSVYKANKLKAVKYSTRIELFKRLNRAKDYIYSNYSEKVDINTLSKAACLSPYRFLRSFKAAFGNTPNNYLQMRRMDVSGELLLRTEKSISEICTLVGFDSLSSFGVLFKKFKGLSPEKFRSRQKKQL